MSGSRRTHHAFALPDRSYQGLVRRDVARLAERWGFDQYTVGKLNIVVAEMTSNLVKHTPLGGELLIAALGAGPTPDGIEVICLDSGPGMRDPGRMQHDGTSTYGSKGEGLGAIRRQADTFDLYSAPGVGTAILVRLYRPTYRPAPTRGPRVGGVLVAKPGEEACGDGWGIRHTPQGLLILALDALGHGPVAEQVTSLALTAFEESVETSPAQLLQALHPRLKNTRGAVAAIALLDQRARTVAYCGVGNLTGRLLGGGSSKGLISHNGIVGYALPSVTQELTYATTFHQVLLLASDGLKTRWDWTRYPGLPSHDPTLMAAVLYRDQNRGTDDTMVLIAVLSSAGQALSGA